MRTEWPRSSPPSRKKSASPRGARSRNIFCQPTDGACWLPSPSRLVRRPTCSAATPATLETVLTILPGAQLTGNTALAYCESENPRGVSSAPPPCFYLLTHFPRRRAADLPGRRGWRPGPAHQRLLWRCQGRIVPVLPAFPDRAHRPQRLAAGGRLSHGLLHAHHRHPDRHAPSQPQSGHLVHRGCSDCHGLSRSQYVPSHHSQAMPRNRPNC